jgi:hypothetical protein
MYLLRSCLSWFRKVQPWSRLPHIPQHSIDGRNDRPTELFAPSFPAFGNYSSWVRLPRCFSIYEQTAAPAGIP